MTEHPGRPVLDNQIAIGGAKVQPRLRLLSTFGNVLRGKELRFVGAFYFQRVFMLALVTAIIVVSLDISVNFQSVMSLESDVIQSDGFDRLVYYALLRLSFITPSVLFFVGIWGVVWVEYSLSRSRERIMLFNCGHSYLASLAPALLLGILIALLQFCVGAFIKPATVELEATTTHRYYGPKFERPVTTESKWIAGENFILNGQIEIADTVSMKNVFLYELNENGTIRKITTADRITSQNTKEKWFLANAEIREYVNDERTVSGQGFLVSNRKFEVSEAELKLSPIWLENFEILPGLLPHSMLQLLIQEADGMSNLYKYNMALHERYASILYCIATILLTAYLAISKFPPDMLPLRAFGVALIGFAAFFFYSVFLMLGHFGYLPVIPAAWGIPVLVTSVFFILLARDLYNVRTAKLFASKAKFS